MPKLTPNKTFQPAVKLPRSYLTWLCAVAASYALAGCAVVAVAGAAVSVASTAVSVTANAAAVAADAAIGTAQLAGKVVKKAANAALD